VCVCVSEKVLQSDQEVAEKAPVLGLTCATHEGVQQLTAERAITAPGRESYKTRSTDAHRRKEPTMRARNKTQNSRIAEYRAVR
jgi:hypothetical protein